MSAIHGVEGLIKWIKGDEWRNELDPIRGTTGRWI